MEATAIHDFTPTQPGELSFRKNDILIIYDYKPNGSDGWFSASVDGKRGAVPSTYIEVYEPSWFKGVILRSQADKYLADRYEGNFLVRLSESCPDDYSLSVKCKEDVQHFRILRDENYKFYLWQDKFHTLNELVNYYKTESVSRTQKIYLREIDEPMTERYVIAKYDFPKNQEEVEENELPFKAGEKILLMNDEDEHWWAGSLGNREGFFPKTYVELYDPNRH